MKNNLNDLRKKISSNLQNLTIKQKKVANFIMENPQKCAFFSIRELEAELNVSKATIIRLMQALGYKGFQELRSNFKNVFRNLAPLPRYKKFLSEASEKSSPNNYLQLFADETINNVHDTLILVDNHQYKRAVHMIKNAGHVFTMGLGISSYLAEISAYLLNRISIKAHPMVYRGQSFAEQIINITHNDVIMAFSLTPYSQETIQAASYAQEKKIKVISVTDKATSDIIPYSDVYLQAAVKSVSISNSIAPILMLLTSMVTQIGYELKNKTLSTIDEIEHIRKEHSRKGT